MKKEHLKEIVKNYFNLVEAPEVVETVTETPEKVEVKFAEAKLEDGTVVTNMVDAPFEVGQELHIVTAEGEHLIAPAGEHVLESGEKVVVDASGVISEILPVEEAPVEEALETVEEIVEEKLEEEVGEVELPITEEVVKDLIEAIVGPQLEELKQELKSYKEKMEKVAKEPATQPSVEKKFSKQPVKIEGDFVHKDAMMRTIEAFKTKRK